MEDVIKKLVEVIEQQKVLLEKFVPQAGSSSTQAPPTNHEFLMESLSKSISDFVYDPENGVYFKTWYARYEDLFSSDAAALEDAAKVRLLLRKLGTIEHQRYIDYILPKFPKDYNFEETVKKLKNIFDAKESIFSLRYKALQLSKKEDEDYVTYASRVNKQCEEFQLNKLTMDQFKSLMFVIGLKSDSDADIRTKLLLKLEDESSNSTISLESLKTECDKIRNLKLDNALFKQPSKVHHVHKKNNFPKKSEESSNKTEFVKKNFNSDKPKTPCWKCGDVHFVKNCGYIDHICKKCNKKGHKEGYCQCYGNSNDSGFNKSKKPNKSKSKRSNAILQVNKISTDSDRKYVDVSINNVTVTLQFDSASDITIISPSTWKKIGSPKLLKSTFDAKDASLNDMQFAGEFQCNLKFQDKEVGGTVLVFKTSHLDLLGLDFISKLCLFDKPINSFCNSISLQSSDQIMESFKNEFPQLFRNQLGKCIKKVKLHIKPGAKPVFRPKRPVAFSVLAKIEEELQRLQDNGVIEPITFSQWAAPIVVVKKPNGKIRITADYSTGLNAVLESNHFPLPTLDDFFNFLTNRSIFSKIDLTDAYYQVEVEDECKEYLAINTHKGLFRMNRLGQGIKTGSSDFQQLMSSIFADLADVFVEIDDVLIASNNSQDHLKTLREVLKRLNDYGFTLKIEKCHFFVEELKFLGHIVNSKGIRPDPAKIQDIVNLPEPTNVPQLRSLLGSISAYSKFIPDIRKIRAPFDELLQKGKRWSFNEKCKENFKKFKEILTSDICLTQFNPELPIIVAGDASNDGLGAIIMHAFPDGSRKVIQYASRSLAPAEKNYSQIEKEGLALVFACNRFHRFIYGRKFLLETDHKPLLSIFGSKKGIPVYTANRLMRWSLNLMMYDFDIKYVSTNSFGYADVLSRLINNTKVPDEDVVIACIQLEDDTNEIFQDSIGKLPVTFKMVKSSNDSDKTLKKIKQFVKTEWPEFRNLTKDQISYFNRRNSLSVVQDCLMFGDRVVVSKKIHRQILKQLHRGHPGIVRMKQIAREFVYWPNIDQDIENYVKSCSSCKSCQKLPTKHTLQSWKTPSSIWERVHIDYAGPENGTYYLVVVDALSKWPEVFSTKSITAESTIKLLRECFSRHGSPEILVSDNGSQFTSQNFKEFCEAEGINHIRTPPYHPQSNGQAERFVDTLKRSLKKMKNEGNLDEILQKFLQVYRSTPNEQNKSPAEVMYKRKIRTSLSLLKPPKVKTPNEISPKKQDIQFNRKHGAVKRILSPGQNVQVLQHINNKTIWCEGEIIERIGTVLYNVLLQNGKLVRVHVNHMHKSIFEEPSQTTNEDFQIPFQMLLTDFNIQMPISNNRTNQNSQESSHENLNSSIESFHSFEEEEENIQNPNQDDINENPNQNSSQTHTPNDESQDLNNSTDLLRRSSRARKATDRFGFNN